MSDTPYDESTLLPSGPIAIDMKIEPNESPKMGLFKMAYRVMLLNLSKQMIMNIVFNTMFMGIEMMFPFLYGRMINSIFEMINNGGDSGDLNFYVSVYFTATVIEYVGKYLQKVLITENTVQDLKMKQMFYKSLLQKDIEFFDFFKPGSILSRFNEDFWSLFHLGPENLMSILLLFVKLISQSASLFIISPELFYMHIFLYVFEIFKNYQEVTKARNEFNPYFLQDDMACIASESIFNIKIIKAFSTEEKEFEKMSKKIQELKKLRIAQRKNATQEFRTFLWKVMGVVNIWFAASQVMSGKMTLGNLTTFQILSQEIKNILPDLTWKIGNVYQHLSKCERIFEFIDYKPRIVVKEQAIKVQDNWDGEIQFKDVAFHYPQKPEVNVLKNFNLTIKKGEVVALVGASGSGKSTIAALIQRLYDVQNGSISINGQNLKDYDLKSLHDKFGYVSQDSSLFSDTIEKNITYCLDHYTQEDLDASSTFANAIEFIKNKQQFPDGYQTMLGDRGSTLSGGQKQRIAIARALIKKANILIFDEATSALDANSEHEVQNAIDKIIKQAKLTTVIIAHRLSTIKNCDRIIVMKGGEIIEQGSHAELLQKNGEYKSLVDKQLETSNKENQDLLKELSKPGNTQQMQEYLRNESFHKQFLDENPLISDWFTGKTTKKELVPIRTESFLTASSSHTQLEDSLDEEKRQYNYVM